jgi:DNA-directed RNA polymerase specialized sigma24 family protein
MAKPKAPDPTFNLRDFVQENDRKVHAFCYHLLSSDFDVEELTISVFRSFGEYFRQGTAQRETAGASLRIRLFQIAWGEVQSALYQAVFPTGGGRDTRILKGLDRDVLPSKAESREKLISDPENRIGDRLARVDFGLRVPVVLRDILGFSDDEASKILSLRWGVYRHRLHRGRIDFKDALKGLTSGQPSSKGVSAYG